MKHLFLVRHAKSSWADDRLSDRERPLNQRGESQLAPLGKALTIAGAFEADVYASDARRAQATLSGILPPGFPTDAQHLRSELYTFDYRRLLAWLQRKADAPRITLVGHNPALLELAQWLLPQPPAQLPTGSFVHIHLPIERWRQLDEGCGTLVALLTPADFSYPHFARKLKKRADSEGSNPVKDIPDALHHQIERLQKLERGVALGLDDEFLHQYRIAIRRSRAIAESVQELTGDKSLAKAIKTLRRHARATGPLRDLHVLLQDLPTLCGDDHELLQALQQALESEQASKHGKLSARLVSKRYRDSMDHWLNLVDSRAFRKQVATLRPADIRKAIARRIKEFSRRTARLDDGAPDDDIHRLRKQLKRLRYLMELDTKRWKSDLKSLKARQQLYGRFQDLHVQIELLMSIRDTSPQHPIAALGRIIDTLEARKADTRHQILALGGLDGAPLRHPVL